MLRYYITEKSRILQISEPLPGSWIRLTDPTEAEAQQVAGTLGIDLDDILAATDLDENNRVELADGYTLIIIDIPAEEIRHEKEVYNTIPMGIMLTGDHIVTVTIQQTPVLQAFADGRYRGFSTKKRMRFIYQIMLENTLRFQDGLRDIDRKRRLIEEDIGSRTGEDDLIGLHELESTLVYFATGLSGNSNVLNRLTHYERIEQYPEDKDLLGDVIVENQQAMEMTQIYQGIIDSTRDLMSTILDKRLNNVMKILTSITLILAIPTVISGLYGMNVNGRGMPFAAMVNGFGIICLIILAICAVLFFLLRRLRML